MRDLQKQIQGWKNKEVSNLYLFRGDDERDDVHYFDELAVALADLLSHLCGTVLSHNVLLAATAITERLTEKK